MAHKKGGGSSRNGRDSNRSVSASRSSAAKSSAAGNIIVRQRGTHIHPGLNVDRHRAR